ncbi:unnamed protein product, partial [marine sediment metagenome]
IGIPEEWTRKVLKAINDWDNRYDRFYLLTKQPQNLIKWSPFPPNCWVGVTATDSYMFSNAMFYLRQIEASVKYLSLEPLMEGILPRYIGGIEGINWVIIGAMTCSGGDLAKSSSQFSELTPKPFGNRYVMLPKIEWVEEIVRAADKAGIPVFLKNNLKPLLQQNKYNIYSFPEWAGTQFASTGDCSLAPVNPHPNEAMRKLTQEMPE